MKIRLIENLIDNSTIHPKGHVLDVEDEFGNGLIARSIAIPDAIASELDAARAKIAKLEAEAKETAAKLIADRSVEAAKAVDEAKAKADEAKRGAPKADRVRSAGAPKQA